MLACVLRTTPAFGMAVLLCACCLFANEPPMPFAGYTAVISLQNASPVVKATGSKLATKTRSQSKVSTLPSCGDDHDCVRMLGALINNPNRDWITQAQSAAEYANGARFFAYRALRVTLTCRELILASQDLEIAAARLSTPGNAISPARAANALSLSTVVAAELRNEMTDRC